MSTIEEIPVSKLKRYDRNPRTHDAKQIEKIANSIKQFGFTNPILLWKDNQIMAGHGRLAAAEKLGLKKVPCVRFEDFTEEQYRAYVIADNKLALSSGWDEDLLKAELDWLAVSELPPVTTGFDLPEIQALLDGEHIPLNVKSEDDGSVNAIQVPKLKFGRYEIILADDELRALEDTAKNYGDENGSLGGFVAWLLRL